MVTIFSPQTESDWNEARRLVREYTLSLGIDLSFQDIETELSNLKEKFEGNGGCFFLARTDQEIIGCAGFWRIDESTCEMKRLYVVPSARGQQLGEKLVQMVLNRARDMQYHTILLDTIDTMKSAIELYHRMGFTEIAAYRFNPLEGAKYFSRAL
ncbi:MAG TPA: GNAT family N-acetyltransferase [Cyclobacteriaceae bacterium]|nr:GNAT family N-acetyltransferase [Cyclobacteriaceae bacterium]